MSDYCGLDRLPVEILYDLFDYFVAHELFFSLSGVTNHIDFILHSYPTHRLDLIAVGQAQFDLICSHIRPAQVISLQLSDADATLGQSELFFARFHIEQFTQLRSLTLSTIDCQSLPFIFLNLHKLEHLSLFSFDRSIRYQYAFTVRPIPSYSTNTHIRLLSESVRRTLNYGSIFMFLPLAYLQYVKLGKCSGEELTAIFQDALQLQSLSLCLNIYRNQFNFNPPSNQLLRLNLEIESNFEPTGFLVTSYFVLARSSRFKQ